MASTRNTNSITVNGVQPTWWPTVEDEALLIASTQTSWQADVDQYLADEAASPGSGDHPLTIYDDRDYHSMQDVVLPIIASTQAIPSTDQTNSPSSNTRSNRSSFIAYFVDPSFQLIGTCVWDRNFTEGDWYRKSHYDDGKFLKNYDAIRNLNLSARITELTTEERAQLAELKADREYFAANITVSRNDICSYSLMAHIELTSTKVVNYIMVSQELADEIQS